MNSDSQSQPLVHGVTAEFDSVDGLLAACNRVREAGYQKTDAFTPFPVHGIDRALGIRPSNLPWFSLVAGVIGCVVGLAMQIWMNGVNYQYIISGKPMISLPAFIPVSFELTILLASFGAFFGMLFLNGLPKFSNPLFTNPRFDRATDDRFFLYIDAKDSRFDHEGVKRLLADCGSPHVEDVLDDGSSTAIPKPIFSTLVVLGLVALLPPVLIARMRVTRSSSPRFHVFYDMDFSPAKGAQETTTLFADGRTMRPDVLGTVARGQLEAGLDFSTGIDSEALARMQRMVNQQFVLARSDEGETGPPGEAEQQQQAPTASGEEGESAEQSSEDVATPEEEKDVDTAEEPAVEEDAVAENATDAVVAEIEEIPWLTENPLPLTRDHLELGQTQFNIYCAVCHGRDGSGAGLVARRAQRILSTTWVPPTRIYSEELRPSKYPDGKLFNTITHGIRKMPGYGAQIKTRDRWAIVMYVRAMQESRGSDQWDLDQVPLEYRDTIEQLRNEVLEQLKSEGSEEAS